MALTKEQRVEIVTEHARQPKDTGSPEVQISLITARIQYLVEHLREHKKDKHSQKGLLDLISQRKRLIKFLKRKDYDRYKSLIKKLGLRK